MLPANKVLWTKAEEKNERVLFITPFLLKSHDFLDNQKRLF
jgi:hypothetical protein